ncbi:hypothetical protein E1182_30030, partial [Micromonospora sp. KC721]
MVDENADRARLPGQQPVPERDIEPLWPSEATDPAPARGGPTSTLYPSLTAEVGRPPATAAWAPPPPDGDWPSLQAEPTVPVALPEQHGPEQSRPRPDGAGPTGDAAPGQRVPPGQTPRVDLDLPFTLDQPMTPVPAGRVGPGDPVGVPDAADPVDTGPAAAAETHP